MAPNEDNSPVAVIGGGPAGLTAAYELRRRSVEVDVFEADEVVGGISRTVNADGWRFDIGGHRFFTKVPRVEAFWHEILPEEDFLIRPRQSRILYNGKFFDYPLKPFDALGKLGFFRAMLCGFSYLWARIRPPKDQSTFEGWTSARFGWRLYSIFFKTYTEKLWGVPATEIQSDFAAQRIKDLSLLNAITSGLGLRRNKGTITSLIEEFQYPKFGPGMMWEVCRDKVIDKGGRVHMKSPVVRIETRDGKAVSVTTRDASGQEARHECSAVVSSMPLPELLLAIDPPAPDDVQAAAKGLRFRDFITVALVVPESEGFPDNWVYVHTPGVNVGRVQNFGQWSPFMVKPGFTCLGLEFFVTEGDALWTSSDEDLIAMGEKEIVQIGLCSPNSVSAGYVVRMPKAYPMYDTTYKANVQKIRDWLDVHASNVFPVGRNGMHKYNNQDHSMYTAMLSVENLVEGAHHDIWSVNVEADYHEESKT
jgi:protoporphyrinogen oxidase